MTDENNNLPVVVASRVTLPDDTNIAGNVHGGTILRFMTDNGGMLAAKRFVNMRRAVPISDVALVSIASMEFWGPMYVGELMEIEANVLFTSTSSIEVNVKVFADDLMGNRRLTNEAILWYVALGEDPDTGKGVIAKGLPLACDPETAEGIAANERYEAQKQRQKSSKSAMSRFNKKKDLGSKDKWNSHLAQVMLPSDCYNSSFVQGGVILKLVDNAAGIAAFKHCKSNVVTASLEALDFNEPVKNGNLVTVRARPTYASTKSMEIQVLVEAEDLMTGRTWVVAHAYLVFVALDRKNKVKEIESLEEPSDEDEEFEREQGHLRYLERKRKLSEKRNNKKKNQE